MKFNVSKLQEGGQVQEGQPTQGSQPSPEEQIVQVAQQLLSQIGPEGCAMLIQVLGQMLEQAQVQPAQQAPTMQRKGGRLVPISRK